jgi:hypothetical protein
MTVHIRELRASPSPADWMENSLRLCINVLEDMNERYPGAGRALRFLVPANLKSTSPALCHDKAQRQGQSPGDLYSLWGNNRQMPCDNSTLSSSSGTGGATDHVGFSEQVDLMNQMPGGLHMQPSHYGADGAASADLPGIWSPLLPFPTFLPFGSEDGIPVTSSQTSNLSVLIAQSLEEDRNYRSWIQESEGVDHTMAGYLLPFE